MVCGVHGGSNVKWVTGGMQRRGLIPRAFYVPDHGRFVAALHMTGSGKKG